VDDGEPAQRHPTLPGWAFILDVPTFDERSIREAILNSVSHCDYRQGGNIFVRQYTCRVTIESPGGFPPGINEANVLERQNPRNRRIADIFAKCGLVERSGQGMNLFFDAAIRQSKPTPDFAGTDRFQVRLTLEGEVRDPAFVRFLERVTAESSVSFSTTDLVVLDHIRRDIPVPEGLGSRITALVENGIMERVSRGRGQRYVLSRRFYQFIGQAGVYTRKHGLDRDTNKALLVKHIKENALSSAKMETLRQVLTNLSRSQIQVLLRELTKAGVIHHHGATRAVLWYLGLETVDCNNDRVWLQYQSIPPLSYDV
jgi:ATP-dependent DNA helicase RecG